MRWVGEGKIDWWNCCLRKVQACLLVVAWTGLMIPGLLFGQETEETHIESNTMTAQSKQRRAVFKGSVVLTQGDLIVHSDVMIVWWKPKPSSSGQSNSSQESQGGNKIEKMVAKGKVIIKKPSGRATSRQAVYYKDIEKIVLTGSPVAWQDGTRVSGEKMTMYLKEDRTEVEGETRVLIQEEADS